MNRQPLNSILGLPVRLTTHVICGMSDAPLLDYYDDKLGQHVVYCSSCRCYQPIQYGYSQRIKGAMTLDIDGPVNPTRIITESIAETFCGVCGHRVYTSAEGERLKEEEANENAKWIAVLLLFIIVLGIIIAMILTADG